MNRLKRKQIDRPRAFWGALISAGFGIINSMNQAERAKKEAQRQANIQDYNNLLISAPYQAQALNAGQDYQQNYLKQFKQQARLGTTKRLGSRNIMITDGGNATKIGNDTYLLRGGSHEQTNETGQTGIGINVGGNEIEAEGGEVAQKKNGALRIFSAKPILGNGMSPAQAILRGYNKDKVFSAQQAFKRRNGLKDDGNKARHGTAIPYKRIHINEDGTFTDTLTGKVYNTSATNGEDVVITGKANHWKEAGKKNTSSYFDPMGAVNFAAAAGAPILNANPSNIIGSIRDSKSASDFLKHYMMQDTGGFVNTEWAKEHPYLSLGINTIGDIGLGIGTNKAVDILRYPMNYGKYGYKLNKFYKKAGLLDRGEYKTIQENYEKLLDYYTGNKPYDAGAADYTYDIKARNNAENVNPDIFYSYVYPSKRERDIFRRAYNKKATDNVFTEMHAPIRYGFDFRRRNDVKTYEDLMNHNPEYYEFLKETRLPWDEQSTVDEFLKRQQTSLRGVYADDKETAKHYLTTILGVRKGGDRLNTHGGLYTSNSTGIADAFKNPDDGISNGYIGKLLYDFDIDKTKPIADQLRQIRMKIVRGGRNNVFKRLYNNDNDNKLYDESINDARRKGAVAVEDNYGRSNGDVLNVTERAYFPGSAKQNKLTLQNLEEYLAQENQKGRWNTSGVDKMKGDEELFIPREYNRFDDFIREARIFMKPRREYDSNKERKFMTELADRMLARSKYRNSLIDMSKRLRKRNEPHSTFFDVNKKIPLMDIYEPLMDSYGPFRFGGRCKLRNGGLTSKDRGSSKHPYPSVSSKDFAGGGRSYPIPTKADAVDALRLAGLHGRSDVKAKVYSRYPELRKKARGGAKIEPYYDWARNTSSNLGISFIDPTYDYRAYYNSITPYERALIRFAPQGTHFTDIGKTPKHPTFSNESKYSNNKTPGGTWNGNVFVPNIWQFGNNGNSRRNKYMNNSGEGYFNGRVNVFPTSRKRNSLGCRTKLRNGGWKAPVYNTNKYRVSNRMRQQIATWEGSDFAGQNRKFNGDAIGAKERELRQIMGRTYNYLTDNQRDSLNSIYYNSRVDTFKNRFGKWFRNLNDAVDRGDERAFNNSLAGIRQSMNIGENRKGMSGLAKRRAWERNWFGNPIPMDSNETKAILKQQAEARMVQPTDNTRVVIQPEYIEVPAPVGHGVIPVDNPDPNLLQGNIKDNLINMGNKFRLRQKCGGKTRMRCGGSTRMRKALGCESRPVKGMRSKLAWGDVVYPYRRNNNFDYWDIIDQEQKTNDKGGITPWTTSNKYDVKVPYAITKSTPTIPYTSKISTPTSKVSENKTSPTNNGNKSGMILRDADWYSLGADLIGTIGAGIIGAKSASNIYIPNIPVPYQASKLNTNYNITPQLEAIKRSRNRLANEISNNTSSSVAAINRLNLLENNANEQLNKLYNIKENRESELLNQDALNQQSVSAQNVQAMNDYNYRVAELKNARTQAMGNVLTGTLQGIGNSFQNLISQGRQNYDDTQAMLMGVAASDYATPSRLLELGVDVGDDAALAGIYRSAMNIPNPGAKPKREDYSDNTEYSYALTRWENQNKAYQRRNSYADLIKGRMSKKNLIKYGII